MIPPDIEISSFLNIEQLTGGYRKPVQEGPPQTPSFEMPARFKAITPAVWEGKAVPKREWCVKEIIPDKNVTVINADDDTGKTTLTLQLQAALALGADWIGQETQIAPSLGVYCEDDEEELQRRVV